jgi:hypothetical protein
VSKASQNEVSASKLWTFTAVAAAGLVAADARAEIDYTAGPIDHTGGNSGIGIDFNGDSGVANPSDNREAFVGVLTGDGSNSRAVLKVTEGGSDDAAVDTLQAITSTANSLPVPLAFGTSIGGALGGGTQWTLVPSDIFTGLTIRDEAGNGNIANNSPTEQFIGVQFAFATAPTDIHYGWIGVRNINPAADSGTVTGYAYETTPNTPIGAGVVPEPTGLALIAMGAAATGLRRRAR